jgi:hypothetical protein
MVRKYNSSAGFTAIMRWYHYSAEGLYQYEEIKLFRRAILAIVRRYHSSVGVDILVIVRWYPHLKRGILAIVSRYHY